MPLEKGNNPTAVKHNIETEVAAGKPQQQAVAIALHTAKDAPETVLPSNMSLADINQRNRDLWNKQWKSGSQEEL